MREGDRTLNEVLDAVAKHYEITREQLVSGRTFRRPRRVAMYLALRVTRNSLMQIGAGLGGVSNTNVMHARLTIARDMTEDADFASEVEGINASLLTK